MIDYDALVSLVGHNASSIWKMRDLIYQRGDLPLTEQDNNEILILAQSMIRRRPGGCYP